MPGRDTEYEELARAAVERVERDRSLQAQLSLLPDEVDQDDLSGSDRAPRGKGKALSQMREYLAAKGYRFPEEVLAQIAGLAQAGDSLSVAMAEAERILTWAEDGAAEVREQGISKPARATLGQRINVLQQVRTAQLRAADALMPYGAPKATPDAPVGNVVQVIVPGPAASDRGPAPLDVTPQTHRITGRMMPANVAAKMQENQRVADAVEVDPDAATRTQRASD